jgi:hypothetical protein
MRKKKENFTIGLLMGVPFPVSYKNPSSRCASGNPREAEIFK